MCALLLLWDVDHTLIENNGVNKETYAAAFELITGRPAEQRARTSGRTEPEVMRDMLAIHGIDVTPGHTARMMQALEKATLANTEILRERGHELPGAREALIAFSRMPDVIQSVLSGNIRPNAAAKLSAFGLQEFMDFEIGGYGGDGADRASLVAVAQSRAAEKYGEPFGKENTVLVGDTPRDVQAGLKGGARVVAVATGSDSAEALRAEGADIVLLDLRDTTAVVRAVTALGG